MHGASGDADAEGNLGLMGCRRVHRRAKTDGGLEGRLGLLDRGPELFLGELRVPGPSCPGQDRLRVGVELRFQVLQLLQL